MSTTTSTRPRSGNRGKAQKSLRAARDALARGDTLGGMQHLAKAIKRDPRCGAAYLALGKLLLERGERSRAEGLLQRAVMLLPDEPSGHLGLGLLLRARGRHDRAHPLLQRAVTLAPDSAIAHRELGEVQLLEGDLQGAAASFETLRRLRPEDESARVGLAAVAERSGDPEAAVALLEPEIRSGSPTSPMLAVWGRACARTGRAQQAADVLGPVVEHLSGEKRERLEHVYGECLERLDLWSEAFEAHRRANDIQDPFYDPSAHTRYVDSLIASFGPECLDAWADAAPTPQPVVLVVGMPRSGTSLVETILARHHDVHANGEIQLLPDLAQSVARQFGGYAFPEGIADLTEAVRSDLGTRYLQELTRSSPAGHTVTDKLPDNYLLVGLASILLPGVKIVWCQRDPLDTCLSAYFQDFGPRLSYSRRLTWLGARYRDHDRLKTHWEGTLPSPMHTVQYESLVANPEGEIRALLEHCGLAWDDACLQPEQSERVVATASYAQVKQQIHTRAVGRAEVYAAHLDTLREALHPR